MILRDRDANTAWESQADQTPEERVYYCQNWRADVVALMTSAGALINQIRYDPYGVPFGIAKTDLDADGDVDNADATLFATYHGASTMPYADWDWDGTKDLSDQSAYTADKNADSGLGKGVPAYTTWSHLGAANRKLYAGYGIDPVLTGSEGRRSVYHVRHRVYLSHLGRWTARDPAGYIDIASLYTFAAESPALTFDIYGLWCTPWYPVMVDRIYGDPPQFDIYDGPDEWRVHPIKSSRTLLDLQGNDAFEIVNKRRTSKGKRAWLKWAISESGSHFTATEHVIGSRVQSDDTGRVSLDRAVSVDFSADFTLYDRAYPRTSRSNMIEHAR